MSVQQRFAVSDQASDFVTSEGLRAILQRLHAGGPGAWRHDSEAAALMVYTAERYAALARKHGLEPDDAARAAFETMLNDATRTAADPWAVVTVGVRISLIAEERANGLLTSTERARRAQYSAFHDAERFSDREADITEYHPAFHTTISDDRQPTASVRAVDDTITLLVLLGWPDDIATTGVEYVCSRLTDAGDRHRAYETLRRDKSARAHLDLTHQSWIGLLRIVLGHPSSPSVYSRRGVLLRLLIGDDLTDLLDDDQLVHAIVASRPAGGGGCG
jgi:hypothetical protein